LIHGSAGRARRPARGQPVFRALRDHRTLRYQRHQRRHADLQREVL